MNNVHEESHRVMSPIRYSEMDEVKVEYSRSWTYSVVWVPHRDWEPAALFDEAMGKS